jgi:mannose-6-phosphate isomerase-like protein (cupin superfamily)
LPFTEIQKKAIRYLNKPYGGNCIILLEENYGISCAQFLPDQSCSLHYHNIKKEFFLVKEGRLTLILEDTKSEIEQGNFSFSTPQTKHSLINNSKKNLEILELFSPPFLNDKVRLLDKYNRKRGLVTHEE